MENETPQKEQTGGLKLMTVFIVVLALHVFVIGGITVYHFFKGENKDASLAQGGKNDPTAIKSIDDAVNTQAGPTIQTEDATAGKSTAVNGTPDATKSVDGVESETATTAPKAGESAIASETVDSATVTDTTKTVVPMTKSLAPAPAVAAQPLSTPAVAMGSATYTVKSGDTLSKIAKRNAMTVADLKKINGLKSNNIKVGQNLQVKASAGATSVAATAPASVVPTAAPMVADKMTATASATTYKVSSGDTLIKIAKKFNTSAAAIMAANKIVDANKLKVGMPLMIPQKSEKRSVTESPAQAVPTQTASAAPDLVMNR